MGNALVCGSHENVNNEYKRLPSGLQPPLEKRPQSPKSPLPHLCNESRSRPHIFPADVYNRGGHSQQRQGRRRHQRDHRDVSAGPLSSYFCSPSGSICSDSDLECASVTPHFDWLPSPLHCSDSHADADPLEDHVADIDALLSYSGSDRILRAPHRDVSTESSGRSSYLTLSNSGHDPSPDLSFDDHLVCVGAPGCSAPLSDPPTPVPLPLLQAANTVKSPDSNALMLPPFTLTPAPTTSSLVVAPSIPATLSSNAHVSRDTVTEMETPMNDRRSFDGKSETLRNITHTALGRPSLGTHAPQTPVPLPGSFAQKVRSHHAVHEVKPKRSIASRLSIHQPIGRPRTALLQGHITNSSATMTRPGVVAGTVSATVKAVPLSVDTRSSPSPSVPAEKPPVLSRELMCTVVSRVNRKNTPAAPTANEGEGVESLAVLWEDLAAQAAYGRSGAGSPPIGTPDIFRLPDRVRLRTQEHADGSLHRLPAIRGPSALMTRMKPVKDVTGRTSQTPANDGEPGHVPTFQAPLRAAAHKTSEDVPHLESAVCAAAALPLPPPAKGSEGREAMKSGDSHASASSPAEMVTETRRLPSLPSAAGRHGSVTWREGDSVLSPARDVLFESPHEYTTMQGISNKDHHMDVGKRRALQDALWSSLLSTSLSTEKGEDEEQQIGNSKEGAQVSSESQERCPVDSPLSLKHNSLGDSIPGLGPHLRIDSILKRHNSHRSHDGSPLAQTPPVVGSVSFLLCEEEAALAMVSRQGVAKAVSRRSKLNHPEEL